MTHCLKLHAAAKTRKTHSLSCTKNILSPPRRRPIHPLVRARRVTCAVAWEAG